jgi:nucleotide-binding universal stress UspA family protein
MLKHIVVPLDGSEFSQKALDYALNILDADGKLTLVTVVDQPYTTVGYMPDMVPLPLNQPDFRKQLEAQEAHIQEEARTYLEKYAEKLRTDTRHIDTVVVCGEPAQEIINATEKAHAEAIVMATHGRTGLSRWFLGSVTQRVLNAAPVPVVVIPNRPPTK